MWCDIFLNRNDAIVMKLIHNIILDFNKIVNTHSTIVVTNKLGMFLLLNIKLGHGGHAYNKGMAEWNIIVVLM